MNEYEVVPLQDAEAPLPIAQLVTPHIAFSNTIMWKSEYEVVRLDDHSRYEVAPMEFGDQHASPKLGF